MNLAAVLMMAIATRIVLNLQIKYMMNSAAKPQHMYAIAASKLSSLIGNDN